MVGEYLYDSECARIENLYYLQDTSTFGGITAMGSIRPGNDSGYFHEKFLADEWTNRDRYR